jgi:hypothetical protein
MVDPTISLNIFHTGLEDERTAAGQRLAHCWLDVHAEHGVAGAGQRGRQGQADIAHPDDPDGLGHVVTPFVSFRNRGG